MALEKAPWEVDDTVSPVTAGGIDTPPWETQMPSETQTRVAPVPDPYAQDFNNSQKEVATDGTRLVRDDQKSAAFAEMLRQGKTDDELSKFVGRPLTSDEIDGVNQWRSFLKLHPGATPAADVVHSDSTTLLQRINAHPLAAAIAAFGNAAAAGAPGQVNPDLAALAEAHPLASIIGDLGGTVAGSLLGEAAVAGKAAPAVGDALYGLVRGGVEHPENRVGGALAGAIQAGAGGAVAHAVPAKARFGSQEGPSSADILAREGVDIAALPQGMSADHAAELVVQSRKLQNEAQNFKSSTEPDVNKIFPTDETRAADAEAWGHSLNAPVPPKTIDPIIPEVAQTFGISKKAADDLFAATQKKPVQSVKEWQTAMEKSARDFMSRKTDDVVLEPKTVNPKTIETPQVSQPVNEVMTKLTDAINNASKIETKVQRRLYSEERRNRLARATAARKNIGGEGGLNAALSELKGELPKAEFEGVRNQFSEDEIKTLFDHINNSENLSGFEPINAQIGLRKLLDGELPTASEIKVMDKVFPPDFLKTALKHRSFFDKASDVGANLLNLPRSMKSTLDLSAPFTQGAFLVGRKEFWHSFSSMFEAFGSEKTYNDLMEGIRSHPNYPWMEEGKLALTDIHGPLSQREEQFMSNYAEKIPVLGRAVKASDRAYTAFLNKLRADTFSSILEKFKAAGVDINDDPKLVTDLGKFINNATGRGDLGKHGNAAAPLLSGMFFSPRLMAARVNMLNPATYARLHPEVRKEALKSLMAFGAIATTTLSLAAAAGASVEADPRSSDFAKIRVGNTRYNVLGGFGSYLTLGARMATQEKKTIKGEIVSLDGKKFGSSTRLGVGADFLRSKLSPVVGYAVNWADGKNVVGEPFDATKDTLDLFTPMFLADSYQLMSEEGLLKGAVMAAPSVIGFGTQTFDVNKKPGKAEAPKPTQSKTETESKLEAPWENEKISVAEPTAQEANDAVTSLLEERGLIITDSGIRSRKTQEALYRRYKGVAKPGTSDHEKGRGIDIAPPSDGTTADNLEQELSDAGLVGVKIIARRHGSGPHWHIQWEGLA